MICFKWQINKKRNLDTFVSNLHRGLVPGYRYLCIVIKKQKNYDTE